MSKEKEIDKLVKITQPAFRHQRRLYPSVQPETGEQGESVMKPKKVAGGSRVSEEEELQRAREAVRKAGGLGAHIVEQDLRKKK